jgi:hypothetical protein
MRVRIATVVQHRRFWADGGLVRQETYFDFNFGLQRSWAVDTKLSLRRGAQTSGSTPIRKSRVLGSVPARIWGSTCSFSFYFGPKRSWVMKRTVARARAPAPAPLGGCRPPGPALLSGDSSPPDPRKEVSNESSKQQARFGPSLQYGWLVPFAHVESRSWDSGGRPGRPATTV